jgi:hypothetical protein
MCTYATYTATSPTATPDDDRYIPPRSERTAIGQSTAEASTTQSLASTVRTCPTHSVARASGPSLWLQPRPQVDLLNICVLFRASPSSDKLPWADA